MPAEGKGKTAFEVRVAAEDLAVFKRRGHDQDNSRGRERANGPSDEYVPPSISIQSDHAEIRAQAKRIVSARDADLVKVIKLVWWMAGNIKNSMRSSFTALEVRRSGEGECKAHTSLYTTLARSLKIPTCQVTGVVYTDKGGFLYHAWAESYVNGWLAVDPTFKQVPAFSVMA